MDFNKGDRLVPVVIQDNTTLQVLMAGYMNEEAYRKTEDEGLVTFYSRSRQSLWTKGETSGNYLRVVTIETDCDSDTILIKAEPAGPVCHTGTWSCFGEQSAKGFIYRLEDIINSRIEEDSSGSYTSRLFNEGTGKIAQKVGEEAVELVIEAMGDNIGLFKNEAADLLYHLLILLRAKQVNLSEIEEVLLSRH
ncbi:MAG TPA: bifunctional phosphoribosyl-AMP cyclohydrolase/phosphoribosyl-ATP diphosphatase HisIE [Bacteroidales bacterium]|nr:bifunctional phosphoribosyl-AMP cyclohydrolase/phosphoribosyl-ATP diphosphatase HisIE [Bacteroidales bacterium]HOC48392.1 bifunctional phosphoribosyl-AMP cyclohydrolase/phosphoribosyl-ATP diphosphatase HisIE [Bacteroidales bacterium]